MSRRPILACLAMSLLVACSTGASPSPTTDEPTASPSEAVESTAPPASSEPALSDAAGACAAPNLCGEPLEPGEYRGFVGATEMTFTLGEEGWTGTQYDDLGFDLAREGSSGLQVLSTAPYSGVVFTNVCSGAETEEIGMAAADFVSFLAERPGITPRNEPTEVTIGGRSGVQLDVDAGDPGCEGEPPGRLWLWELGGRTDFHLNIGEAARLIALDGDGGVIVIILEAFNPTTFEDLLSAMQPVLDSLAFGP